MRLPRSTALVCNRQDPAPTGTAQNAASTAACASALKFCTEDRTMFFLVRQELRELCEETASHQPGDENLPGVDVRGAVLTGVMTLMFVIPRSRSLAVVEFTQESGSATAPLRASPVQSNPAPNLPDSKPSWC
jgi:hypothetical protein